MSLRAHLSPERRTLRVHAQRAPDRSGQASDLRGTTLGRGPPGPATSNGDRRRPLTATQPGRVRPCGGPTGRPRRSLKRRHGRKSVHVFVDLPEATSEQAILARAPGRGPAQLGGPRPFSARTSPISPAASHVLDDRDLEPTGARNLQRETVAGREPQAVKRPASGAARPNPDVVQVKYTLQLSIATCGLPATVWRVRLQAVAYRSSSLGSRHSPEPAAGRACSGFQRLRREPVVSGSCPWR